MEKVVPPGAYEDLIRLIHDRFDGMSKTYQRIALFLTQNPNDVAVSSVSASAERCGIHPSSFVRFAQLLGYRGFKDLQVLFQRRLATAAPGFEARVRALESELQSRDNPGDFGFLRDLVVRDIASLEGLLNDIEPERLNKAAKILEASEVIYLVGQLRSAPVVELLRYVLTMVGKKCLLLDANGGLATHMARTMGKKDALIAVSFRFYANEVVNITEAASASGVPIVAITDSSLSPIAKSASVLFSVPEHDYSFSRSLAAPICLAQALAMALAARMQNDRSDPRIPTVTGP